MTDYQQPKSEEDQQNVQIPESERQLTWHGPEGRYTQTSNKVSFQMSESATQHSHSLWFETNFDTKEGKLIVTADIDRKNNEIEYACKMDKYDLGNNKRRGNLRDGVVGKHEALEFAMTTRFFVQNPSLMFCYEITEGEKDEAWGLNILPNFC